MRKILLATVLLLSAAACGTSPTSAAAAGEAQLSTAPTEEVCTKFATAGNRTCQPPAEP